MAGLDPAVTQCEANAPWLCDMGGKARLGRNSGWQPAFTDALNYYDPVHHAARIPETCRVNLSRAGLGDNTCPPSGIAAVFNAVRGPASIRFVQGSEHQDWGKIPDGTQTFTLSRD
jgi:cephalosporin-C deacetylase-like acetyl esterase